MFTRDAIPPYLEARTNPLVVGLLKLVPKSAVDDPTSASFTQN
jgi:hypothetical protein